VTTTRWAHHTGLALTSLAVLWLTAGSAEAITFHTTLNPIRMSAQPGQVLTSLHHLSLDQSQPRAQFRAHVEDWWRSADGRESFYVAAGTLPRSCGSWVAVNPGEASLSGGEQLSIRVTVSVPAGTASGGYWCALTIDEVPDPLAVTPDSVAVQFLASVSTAIYVNVGQIDRAIRIVDVGVSGSDVVLDVENAGNTPLSVEGRVEFLRDASETPVASVRLERAVLLTDPIAAGHYVTPLPAAEILPAGRYRLRVVLDIGVDHLIGAQKDVLIQRDDGSQLAQ
jgi:hypothetical protein